MIKHYKCPRCKRTTSTLDKYIPKCKCSGKTEEFKTKMIEIKSGEKDD